MWKERQDTPNVLVQEIPNVAWFTSIRELSCVETIWWKLSQEKLLNSSSLLRTSRIHLEEIPLQNPKNVLWTNLWKMPYCILGQIEIILHLLYIRKETRIKTLLIYILQFFSCSMLYCAQYKSISPWVSTVLALLSLVTLGYLSWCQEKHIEYLNRSIIELCTQLPPSNDAGDVLHEN